MATNEPAGDAGLPQIDMQLVPDSSQIAAIGFDAPTRTLAVQFVPRKGESQGSLYHYANATPQIYEAFQAAKSKGDFFYANIRHNTADYPFNKIRDAVTGEQQAA